MNRRDRRRLASQQRWSRAEVRAAFQQLAKEGRIVPTGEMRPNRDGELEPVYIAAESPKARALKGGVSSDCKCFVYLNPKASQEMKDFVAQHFSDGTRVSAIFMQEMTGGLADEGPPLSNYSAAVLDEAGELSLLEPCIPDT
jgi:hypothetical protein